MIFGKCKLHTTRSGVMQILSKFCHNTLNMLDGATYDYVLYWQRYLSCGSRV